MPSDLRVILDTNTIVSALLLPQSSLWEALGRAKMAGRLLVSPATIVEPQVGLGPTRRAEPALRSVRNHLNGYLTEMTPS